jgi:hypothetical protein
MVVGGASNLPFSSPSTMAEPTETRIFSGASCFVSMLASFLDVGATCE